MAIDDFSGRTPEGSGAIFESNVAAYSEGRNIVVIDSDSRRVTPDEVLAANGGSPVRLFSIDGDHSAEHTFSDLTLASRTLADGGVILLSELYNQDWPGVQEGFHRFMSEAGGAFVPLALGGNKLFLCKRRDHAELLAIFKEALRPYCLSYKEVVLWGAEAVSMSLQAPEEVFSGDLSPPRNAFFLCAGALSPRCVLGSGWSHTESNGTWTTAEQAVMEMRLEDAPTGANARLKMEIVPFLHSRKASRRLDVFVNDTWVGSRDLTNLESETFEFAIEPALLRPSTTLALKVESPEQPSALGLSEDQRPLGVKVRSVRIF